MRQIVGYVFTGSVLVGAFHSGSTPVWSAK